MILNGKHLAWSIIHLFYFCYLMIVNFGIDSMKDVLFWGGFVFFFAWRFIENMGKSFN